MEWPLYTEPESEFVAELKRRDNLKGDTAPSILRDSYNGEGPFRI